LGIPLNHKNLVFGKFVIFEECPSNRIDGVLLDRDGGYLLERKGICGR
jgi:hypothetical protein